MLENEVETFAKEVVAEAEKVEPLFAKAVKAVKIDVSAAEKVVVMEIQLEHARLQMQMAQMSTQFQELSKQSNALVEKFKATTEALEKKYAAAGDYKWDELKGCLLNVEKKLEKELRNL